MALTRAQKVRRQFRNVDETAVGGLGIMFKVLPMYFRNKEEREPKAPLGPFRTDVGVYGEAPASGLRLTWFGHSSNLVEIDGSRVLLDPVWDERASPATWFGPKRFFAPTMTLEEMPRLDAVVISHDHYDHLGAESVARLAKAQPEMRWVTALGVGTVLEGFGVSRERITELDWTESTVVGNGLRVTALPSRHFSGRSLFNRFETLWASFVLKGDRHTVYYGADSGYWEGFAEIGAAYGPFDLTMLEVGAFHPLWADIHMGPEGAMRAFTGVGGKGLLMPIHWGLFDLALHAWRTPITEVWGLAEEHGVGLWSPEPGAPTEVVAGQEVRSEWWRKS
jgi:L-ascorbate metabolism protein UlaG (beta-lactamase superfamily)